LPVTCTFDTCEETEEISAALMIALKEAGVVSPPHSSMLEELHSHVDPRAFLAAPGGRIEHDETVLMAILRDFARSAPFQKIYGNLIGRIREEVCEFDFVFERTPVIRCVAPHRLDLQPLRLADGRLMAYHTDLLYADPCGQINCWLSFTDSVNTASVQLCDLDVSLEILREFFVARQIADHIPEGTRAEFFQFICRDKQRLARVLNCSSPLNSRKGQTTFFDMRRLHATADNRELTTRISMDFRIVPLKVYALLAARGDSAPVYAGTKLLKGAFYHALQASEFTGN
jgi:hypothetical protein